MSQSIARFGSNPDIKIYEKYIQKQEQIKMNEANRALRSVGLNHPANQCCLIKWSVSGFSALNWLMSLRLGMSKTKETEAHRTTGH